MASSGSTAPVSVVPAAATISHGRRPAARSAAIACVQGVGPHPVAIVDRDLADPRLAQARDAERLFEAVVGLRRSGRPRPRRSRRPCRPWASRAVTIAVRLAMLPPEAMLPPAVGGVAHQVGHPSDQQVLHPDRARAGEEDPRVLVADRGQVVAERRVVDPAAGDVGEVAARGRVAARAGPRPAPAAPITASIGMPCSRDRRVEQARSPCPSVSS